MDGSHVNSEGRVFFVLEDKEAFLLAFLFNNETPNNIEQWPVELRALNLFLQSLFKQGVNKQTSKQTKARSLQCLLEHACGTPQLARRVLLFTPSCQFPNSISKMKSREHTLQNLAILFWEIGLDSNTLCDALLAKMLRSA